MTRKQVRKLANQVYQCELVHNNASSSNEEKLQAERRIIQITKQVMCLKDGLDILSQIDELVIELASKNEK